MRSPSHLPKLRKGAALIACALAARQTRKSDKGRLIVGALSSCHELSFGEAIEAYLYGLSVLEGKEPAPKWWDFPC